ncbi:efflux RND transporter periplasmic adaptor subunit [Aeoliella sp. SH292]|uniref:efflux RND transporter periplasmic adaptor subunit n=1 Tax=Aeoliella sp. SH292 TaxID=3454464 RepID=UPI003F9743E9
MAFVGCEAPNEYAPPPPPQVTVAFPVEEDVQEYFKTIGRTRALSTVELRSRVSGYLDSINFEDGQLVEKDQLLFVIEKAPYEALVQSAQATLAKAQANLELARRQLARTEPLVSRNAVAESELDQAVAERDAAEADVLAAQAALREANLNLGYTEIRAPFAGRIGRHQVDLGNLVAPSETLLATLESVDPIQAYFTVSESDLLHFLQMQQNGELPSDSEIPVDMAFGNSDDYRFHGKIDFLQFGVDPGTGTTERRALFQNADQQLRPGLFVQIRVPVGKPVRRLLINERAIGSSQQGDYVLVVDADNKVVYHPVQLGEIYGDKRVILKGLKPDERVIVEGLQRARPGSVVTPEEAGKAPAPPAAGAPAAGAH